MSARTKGFFEQDHKKVGIVLQYDFLVDILISGSHDQLIGTATVMAMAKRR